MTDFPHVVHLFLLLRKSSSEVRFMQCSEVPTLEEQLPESPCIEKDKKCKKEAPTRMCWIAF